MTGVVSTDFINRDRADIRRTWRVIEEGGPGAEEPPKEMARLIEDVDFLAVHICPVSKEMIERAKNLKVILSARGGLENIDVTAANERKIPVIHTPHHNAQAVAEYAVGLMICETRNIARSNVAIRLNKQWREYYPNTENIPELNGSTVGLLGLGQTGRLVAQKLRSFSLGRLLVFDPYVDDAEIEAVGGVSADLNTVLSESDIVSLHVRLTKETRGMIGASQLKSMKDSAYLINTARAGLVDTDALVTALKKNWIRGAAIDVFDVEPAPMDHPLFGLDNVTVTNHRAGDTRNAYWKSPLLMGEQLAELLAGGKPRYVVNKHVL
jgi:D-3-phosphoglycerate dehydrogenase / 2-oxoglutarate reductase